MLVFHILDKYKEKNRDDKHLLQELPLIESNAATKGKGNRASQASAEFSLV